MLPVGTEVKVTKYIAEYAVEKGEKGVISGLSGGGYFVDMESDGAHLFLYEDEVEEIKE